MVLIEFKKLFTSRFGREMKNSLLEFVNNFKNKKPCQNNYDVDELEIHDEALHKDIFHVISRYVE